MDDLRSRLERHLADSYRIERELGGGGMSRTYLAFEHALSRRVVIKVLAPELLEGLSVERFRREILLAAQLQHPHVVPVLSAGDAEGLPWFTMPYVDGDSLRQRLAGDALGIGEIISILRDVARALAYAHRHGIVHRDIKPDNVLLSSGSATVTDFGIAKAIAASRTGGGNGRSTLTQVGTSIGTPTYMSPEQAVGDTGTDHRSDIYAFGIMAYELLTGAPPFRGDSAHKLVAAHLGEKPRNVTELRPDAPPMLAELVMHCLEKDPAHRPQHATDLARVLETITSSASTASAPAILRGGSFSTGKALGMWAGVSALVALTAWAATSVIGLPDWVFPGALGVMIAGLPIILFTAYAQRTVRRSFTSTNPTSAASRPQGTMATLAIKASPHLTWRKTWVGGSVAVGAFAALVIGFMVMRASGIGPFATLRSKGVFADRERLVVADFRSPADTALGPTLAEALRSDLAQSRMFVVPTQQALREFMRLMKRANDAPLDFDASREIATREGIKAVLDGDVRRVGDRYSISARLVNALNGDELETFREEADSENELLPAVGRLARTVLERSGESLREIHASVAMERVTTSSLPALRKYVEGSRLYDLGDPDRAEPLLREAVALDSGFAMAWRRLAVVVRFRGLSRQEEIHALEQAFKHRDRLSDVERLMTEGTYYYLGPMRDRERAVQAYEQLLHLDSSNAVAVSALGGIEQSRHNFVRAEEWFRQGTDFATGATGSFMNLVRMQVFNGRSRETIDSTLSEFRRRFPDNGRLWITEYWAASGTGDLDRADSIARAVNSRSRNLTDRRLSSGMIEDIAMLRARYAEGHQWRQSYTSALIEGAPTFQNRFQMAVDSAEYALLRGEPPERVRQLMARGMTRTPLDSMPASERPYQDLMNLAADADDPQLMQTAVQGYMRDQVAQQYDSAGARMYAEGMLAYSRQQWDAAIAAFHGAKQRGEMQPLQYSVFVGVAHDRAGRADSALVYIEKFVGQNATELLLKGRYEARMRKRAAELYEQKGNAKKALEHYNKVLELWRNAEPSMRPEVDAVRQSMERLRARTG